MRRLFIQFYLLLIVCFLAVVILIGSVYGRMVAKVGDRYLNDLLTTSLSLIKTELKDTPPEKWQATLATTRHSLSFPVQVQPLSGFSLSPAQHAALAAGHIVTLPARYLFLQGLPDSRYVLVAGPLRYLMFLDQLHGLDYALIALISLSLAIPVFLWMYPHWRELSALELAARQLADDHRLDVRVELHERSGIRKLGNAFNHMAGRISRLLESKKALTDAVAHELRTPLARTRYRLATLEGSEPADPAARQRIYGAISRDLSEVDALIDEMLQHARLEQPQAHCHKESLQPAPWLENHLARARELKPAIDWQWHELAATPAHFEADPHLMGRALANLLANCGRHAKTRVHVSLTEHAGHYLLQVADDGAGIAEHERQRIFQPFVRLDESRNRDTGGYGLGLAIVAAVARVHGGSVEAGRSEWGGDLFRLQWPRAAQDNGAAL